MKNYVTKAYIYNDIVWGDVEQILLENFISHNNKFIDFKVFVSCKINNDVEIKVYKNEHTLCAVIHFSFDEDTLYVHVAGIKLSSKHSINCTPDMRRKNLTIKFVSRYDNMTYRYYMQQPIPMIETKMVKHLKNMSEEEKIINFNLLTFKHKLISYHHLH